MKTITKFKNKVKLWSKEFEELKNSSNMKLKHSMNYGNKTLIFNISIINRRLVWTRGSSNRTIDNKRIFYIDYDNLKESYVKEELLLLQEQYNLGKIYVFESSESSFHAVSFCKLSLNEFVDILENSSCDYAFKNMPHYLKFSKYWVLRQFSKGNKKRPKFKYCLKAKTNKKQSSAHHKYFKILYPKANIEIEKPDGLKDVVIIDYPTSTGI